MELKYDVFISYSSKDYLDKDGKEIPKIHPSQKPICVLKRLFEIFTDPGDTVIDSCAGSASTLKACKELGRHSYGFEISADFYKKAKEQMLGQATEQTSEQAQMLEQTQEQTLMVIQ